ncbi:MAG: type II secretion system F family protein [bacterium]
MGRDPLAKASRADVRAGWLTALLFASAVITVASAGLALGVPSGYYDRYAGALLGLGLVMAAAGAVAATPRPTSGLLTVGQIRALEETTTGVKVFALLVRLIGLVAVAILILSLLTRAGYLHSFLDGVPLRRGVFLLVIVLAGSLAYVQTRTLRRPVDHVPNMAARTVQTLALALMVALTAVGVWLAVRVEAADVVAFGITGSDFPYFILAAEVACAISLAASRALPSIASLVGSDQRAGAHGRTGKGTLVFLPVVLAFFLVFLVVLLIVIFGVGFAGAMREVADSPYLLLALLFLVGAFGVSLMAAFRLSRAEAKAAPLYKKLVDAKKRRERILIAASIIGAVALFIPAFLLFKGSAFLGFATDAWIHFLCLGLLVLLGPYGFYTAAESRRVRLLEERFPDFLRDVASSHKGGLTLAQSVAVAARGEYGPLSPEVQRMADQLSWNVPFNEALERFSGRVQTPLVQRAVSLILEANRSGGATTDVLLAAARDAREIKFLEQDRRINMSLYTVVIYVTFFVFLGVTAVLYAQFVPQLVQSSNAAAKLAQSSSGGSITGITSGTLDLKDFQLFYFMAAIMQGLGDGIVAGMMGSGKPGLGLRHSFIMVALSYVTFVFVIRA